ncbi:MAG: hypothetical protein M0D57_03730 [Sphingobacteriales bacterium JAD_PAG50586_3]|nr:MAG: hypothetical protein M0D57_03730 [Sphingobacteriales bacterium JAD_PAG50586_3]
MSCKEEENPLTQYEGNYSGYTVIRNYYSQDSITMDTIPCKITVTVNYANKNQLSLNHYDNNNNPLNQWNAVEVNNIGQIAHFGDDCNTFYGTIAADSLNIKNIVTYNGPYISPYCSNTISYIKFSIAKD